VKKPLDGADTITVLLKCSESLLNSSVIVLKDIGLDLFGFCMACQTEYWAPLEHPWI
jgi:hypothetical protein